MTDDGEMVSRSVGAGAVGWAVAAAVLMAGGIAGAFWIAPDDVEGDIQKLLYIHVPIALVSLLAFGVACVASIIQLRTRRTDPYDDVVVVSIGLGLLFVVLTIITGSIWARGFWGTWWRWDDPRLVTYLIIGLIYGAFFVLRSSTEEAQRARFSAVFATIAFVTVPLSFYAVRQAREAFHPVALGSDGLHMDGGIAVWLGVCLVAVCVLFVALLKLELIQRDTARRLQKLRAALEESS